MRICIAGAIIFVILASKFIAWSVQQRTSFVTIFGVFCQQGNSINGIILCCQFNDKINNNAGSETTPNLISGKFVLIITLLLSITVYNYYTSVLVSTLIRSGSKNKIKNLIDLADSPLKIGFEEIPYIHSSLNVNNLIFEILFPKKKSLLLMKFPLQISLQSSLTIQISNILFQKELL